MSATAPLQITTSRVVRIPDKPSARLTLADLIEDSRPDQQIIRRATKAALDAWFRQSYRLNMARHRPFSLRGDRYKDFAERIGADRSSAHELLKLWRWKEQIEARIKTEREAAARRGKPYRYPGWLTALHWFEKPSWSRFDRWGAKEVSDERGTPSSIFQRYGEQCELDVAASHENHLCRRYYTIDDDGLKSKWAGIVWMNPPYSNIYPWAAKAYDHAHAGGTVIALLPLWPSASWFREFAIHGGMTVLKKRVRYTGAFGAAPFDSMIVEWSPATLRDAADRMAQGDFRLNAWLET